MIHAGEYLERIPAHVLRRALLRRSGDSKGIDSLDGDGIREHVRSHKVLTDAEIVELFEASRYEDRPIIRLALFLKPVVLRQLPSLAADLTLRLADHPSPCQVTVRDVDTSFDPDVAEVAISYHRVLPYLDTDERSKSVTELAFGFAWLGVRLRLLAVAAAEDAAEAIREAIGAVVGHEPVWVSISKNAMDRQFPMEHVASISHYDQRERVRYRVTGEHLSELGVYHEVVQRDRTQQRSSAIYREGTSAGQVVNVSVNADRGRINFIGHLRASEMRTWALPKIAALAEAIHNLREESPDRFMAGLRASITVDGLPRSRSHAAQAIAVALIHARLKRVSEFPLASVDAALLGRTFPKRFGSCSAMPFCDQCGELQVVTCYCGETEAEMNDGGQVSCPNRHIGDWRCPHGHSPRADALRDGLQFTFTLEFFDVLSDVLVRLGEATIDPTRETVTVRDDRLLWVEHEALTPGVRTVVCVDIKDATALMQEDEPKFRRLYREVRRELIRSGLQRGGRYAKGTGDGLYMLFDTPVDALRAAIELRALVRRKSSLFENHPVRVGISTGAVQRELDDYGGMPLSIAARLQAKASDPSFILVDEPTRASLRGIRLDRVATMRSLKNIDRDGGYYSVPDRLTRQFMDSLAAL